MLCQTQKLTHTAVMETNNDQDHFESPLATFLLFTVMMLCLSNVNQSVGPLIQMQGAGNEAQ